MRLEALAKAPEAFASTFESESVHPLEWFAERLAANAIFGAFQDTALVGIAAFFVHVAPKVAHKGTLWGMYVQPQARRTGIGRDLAETIISHARQHVEQIQLTVVGGNEAARSLYSNLGVVEYGREVRALKQDGRYHDELLMALALVPQR